MSTPRPSILLVGASGYIGKPLVQEFLLRKSDFSRLAILTTEDKKEKFEVFAQGFELVLGSFHDASSFKGFDTVISLLGDHGMKLQPSIIKACIEAGVQEFYPSEYGSDIEQGEYPQNRYFRDKIITREALRQEVKEHPGFNYTLMMVGGFMEFLTVPLFGCDVESETFTFYGKPEKTEAVTAVKDVARYVVASTLLPKSPTQVREFRVPGGVFSWAEIIATISKASGVEYKSFFLPNEDADRLAKEALEKGDVDAEMVYSLKALMGREGQFGVPKPWDHEKFDIVPQGLEETLVGYFQGKK